MVLSMLLPSTTIGNKTSSKPSKTCTQGDSEVFGLKKKTKKVPIAPPKVEKLKVECRNLVPSEIKTEEELTTILLVLDEYVKSWNMPEFQIPEDWNLQQRFDAMMTGEGIDPETFEMWELWSWENHLEAMKPLMRRLRDKMDRPEVDYSNFSDTAVQERQLTEENNEKRELGIKRAKSKYHSDLLYGKNQAKIENKVKRAAKPKELCFEHLEMKAKNQSLNATRGTKQPHPLKLREKAHARVRASEKLEAKNFREIKALERISKKIAKKSANKKIVTESGLKNPYIDSDEEEELKIPADDVDEEDLVFSQSFNSAARAAFPETEISMLNTERLKIIYDIEAERRARKRKPFTLTSFIEMLRSTNEAFTEMVEKYVGESTLLDVVTLVNAICISVEARSNVVNAHLISMMVIRFKTSRKEMLTAAFNKLSTTVKPESFSSLLDNALGILSMSLHGEVFTSLTTIFLSITSMKLFSRDVSSQIYSAFGKPEKRSIMDLIELILSKIIVLIRCGEDLCNGVPYSQVLTSGSPEADLMSQIDALMLYRFRLYTGLPVEGSMRRCDFIAKAEELMKLSKPILAKTRLFSATKDRCRLKIRELEVVLADLHTIEKAHNRIVPYGIILAGPPGIGKCHLIDHMCATHAKVVGSSFDKNNVFHFTKGSEYRDGYNPASQKYIHIPEVGNISDSILKSKGDPILDELCALIDAQPYSVNVAFEGKGMTFANPDMVIVDSNNPTLGAEVTMKNPSAIFRRFDRIYPVVKKKYRHADGSCAIDPKKSLQDKKTHVLDRWVFKVTEFRVFSNVKYEELKVAENIDIYQLTKLMAERFANHISKQQVFAERIEKDSGEGGPKDPLDFELKRKSAYSDIIEPMETSAVQVESRTMEKLALRQLITYRMMDASILAGRVSDMFVIVMLMAAVQLSSIPKGSLLTVYILLMICGKMFSSWLFWIVAQFGMTLIILSLPGVYVDKPRVQRTLMSSWLSMKFESTAVKVVNLGLHLNYHARKLWERSTFAILPMTITAGALGMSLLYVAKTRSKRESAPGKEKKNPLSEAGVSLDVYESKFACGNSYKRVSNKLDVKIWNVKQDIIVPPHKGTLPELSKRVSRNVKSTYTERVDCQNTITHILGVSNNFALINTHAVEGYKTRRVILHVSTTGSLDDQHAKYYSTIVTPQNCVDLGADVSLLRLEKLQFANITKHFVDFSDVDVAQPGMFGTSSVMVKHLRQTISMCDKGRDIILNEFLTYDHSHQPGVCGIPILMTIGNGCAVVGIHAAGAVHDLQCFATVVRRKQIVDGIANLRNVSPMLIPYSVGKIEIESFEEPISKSVTRFENLNAINYYGKIPGSVMINSKSRLVKSAISTKVERLFEELCDYTPSERYGPPMMMPTFKEREYISPYNVAMRKMATVSPPLDEKILARCVDLYFKRVITLLTKRGVQSLAPLTVDAAINGVEHDPFIRRITANAAAGFGFPGSKSHYIPDVRGDGTKREPTAYLKDRLVKIFDAYEKGETAIPIYKGTLKDEPRTLEKCVKGATRLFYAGQLDNLIASRMFLSPFFSLMVEHGDIFGSEMGFNPMSPQCKLVARMLNVGEDIIEGDYRGYDINRPYEVALAANTLVSRVVEHFGYNAESMKVVNGLLSDELFPFFCVLNDVFMKPGAQPSGKYATAETNSICGIIMLMYAWYSLEGTREHDFWKFTLPLTYGDDVLAAVSKRFRRSFNNNVYKDFCLENFGMEFTTASKSDVMSDFVDIETCTFLKRSFRFSEELQVWVMPLSMDSILKALMWHIPSKVVTINEQMRGTVTSMLWELFLHLNEDEWNVMRERLVTLYSETYINGMTTTFPSWAEIHNSFFPKGSIETESGVSSFGDEESSFARNMRRLGKDKSMYSDYAWQFKMPSTMKNLSLTESKEDKILRYKRMILDQTYDPEIFEIELDEKHEQLLKGDEMSFLEFQLDRERAGYLAALEMLPGSYSIETIENMMKLPLHREQRTFLRTLRNTMARYLAIESRIATLKARRKLFSIVTESGIKESNDIQQLALDENFGDVAGSDLKEVDAGHSESIDHGQRVVTDLGDFLSRPIQIDEQIIAPGSKLSLRYSIWDLFTKEPSVRAKLRNFAYFRGDLHVRLSISGTPFHYGKILVSYQPCAEFNANLNALLDNVAIDAAMRPLMLNYLSQAKGSVVMSINENMPTEIVCPYISTKPMHRLWNRGATTAIGAATSFEDLEYAGDLFLYSINDVKSASTAPTSIGLQIYAWMENVDFGTNTATQIAITTESGVKDERKTGPIERTASRVVQVSNALALVPWLEPFAIASSIAATAVGKVASLFGWSKPVLISDIQYMKQEPLGSGQLLLGTDAAQRCVMDPMQELIVDGRCVATQEDEMVISYLANRPCFLETFQWDDTDAALGTAIYSTLVSPNLGTTVQNTGVNYIQPSPMAFAAAPFCFWRGDIIFRFEIVCSQYHRGKLAFFYEPNINQNVVINAALSLNKQYMKVVDIQQTTEFELRVGWAAIRPWLKVLTAAAVPTASSITTLSTDREGYCNGYVGVVPFTTLQSPDGSGIEVNVYAYSDNLHVNTPESLNVPTERKILVESGSKINAMPSMDIETIDLNESTAVTTHICQEFFGEQPLSFRSLLKRYVTVSTSTLNMAVPAFTAQIAFWMPIFPVSNLPYGATTMTYFDLFTYLRYAYLGYRGGIRHRLRDNMLNDANGPMCNVVAAINNPETTNSTGNGAATTLTLIPFSGGCAFVPHTSGGCDVEFPFYTNNLWCYACTDTNDDGMATADMMEHEWSRNFSYRRDFPVGMPNDSVIFNNQVASGEDFCFLRFLGAPYYTANPVV